MGEGNEVIYSVLSDVAREFIKSGVKFSTSDLKERLRDWLFSEEDIEEISQQIYSLYEKNFVSKDEIEDYLRKDNVISERVKKVEKKGNVKIKQKDTTNVKSPVIGVVKGDVSFNYGKGESPPKKA